MKYPLVRLLTGVLLCGASLSPALAQSVPQYDHVVLVIDENKNDTEIRNSALAPYINNVLLPGSADLTHFVAEQHPSQPNYLHFFSGSDQGVKQDGLPGTTAEPGTLPPLGTPPPFHTPNLGREILNSGHTFASFSESLPSVGFTGEAFTSTPGVNEYVRKHNPAVDWQDDTATASSNPNALPSSVNQAFSAFPTTDAGFAGLPSFSLVVPNEQNDMHDGSIQTGDKWLADHIEPYRQWALTHNSLLIFTFDESDLGALQSDPNNQIITAISGQNVIVGKYTEDAIARFKISQAASPDTAINHYNLLRTIEGAFSTANDASLVGQNNKMINITGGSILPITDIFATAAPEPSPCLIWGAGAGVLAFVGLRRRFLGQRKAQ